VSAEGVGVLVGCGSRLQGPVTCSRLSSHGKERPGGLEALSYVKLEKAVEVAQNK
jgi:hypothetical protein